VTAMFLWENDNYYISECVFVALVIHHEMRMRRTLSPFVACLVHHIFPHYLANGTISEKNIIEHKMTVLTFVQICL
jgi:hypothetical protein